MKIHSIFQSINGEVCADHQGSFCTFVRLQGCNLKCKWCDTPDSQYPYAGMNIWPSQIIKQIEEGGSPFVTITGGEPLCQMKSLSKLVRALIPAYNVSIETNGTIVPSKDLAGMASFVIDYKPVSSGIDMEKSVKDSLFLKVINRIYTEEIGINPSWIKFPVQTDEDFQQAAGMYRMIEYEYEFNLAFSPIFPMTPKKIMELLAKQDITSYTLNVQLHKIIGVA
jgi:7-carboxy-7-deazaguanine synthase